MTQEKQKSTNGITANWKALAWQKKPVPRKRKIFLVPYISKRLITYIKKTSKQSNINRNNKNKQYYPKVGRGYGHNIHQSYPNGQPTYT